MLIEADKWFASSKTCSFCGFVKKDLILQEREWDCPNCGKHHNRDHNAGINLKNYGLKELGLGQPDFKPVEKTASVSGVSQSQAASVKQEASKSLASR
jgi:putative transposase